MKENELISIINDIVSYPKETEWFELKHNFHSNDEIGKSISALSNSAFLHNQQNGYLIFGIEDKTHEIKGTTFKIKSAVKGNEELENWLVQRLDPRIDFKTYEFYYAADVRISMYIIPATHDRPVKFLHQAYIRIGSYTRSLLDFPEKETKIWNRKSNEKFELKLAKTNLDEENIISLLDTQIYFDLLKLPYPSTRGGVINKFISETLITKKNSKYSITNLGAILFAKNLEDFPDLKRKAIRVIVYKNGSRIETIRDQIGGKGYISGYQGLIEWVNSQLPANEEIGKAFRVDKRMYPEIAVRELLANAIIHQDFEEKGFPMVEIFTDRIEITNPGIPLITPERFIDEYQSRNDILADLMRRLGICEEKGSGIDKVIHFNPDYAIEISKGYSKTLE